MLLTGTGAGISSSDNHASPFIKGVRQKMLAYIYTCIVDGTPCDAAPSIKMFHERFAMLSSLVIWKVSLSRIFSCSIVTVSHNAMSDLVCSDMASTGSEVGYIKCCRLCSQHAD